MAHEKQQSWHQIAQDLFDEHLPLLSGRHILNKQREQSRNVHFDYFVITGEPEPEAIKASPILPLSHLTRYNIIELKSIHESLNERTFRGYIGRALVLEDAEPEENRIGQVGLTLITARKPVKLLANSTYNWQELEPWKYRYEWADLEVHLIVLSQLRGVKGGLSLALLQALETDDRHQAEVWRMILDQELPMREVVERIISKMDKEGLMGSFAEDWRQEGREEGKEQKVRGMLSRYLNDRPTLKAKYQRAVDQTTGEAALEDLFFSIIGKGTA